MSPPGCTCVWPKCRSHSSNGAQRIEAVRGGAGRVGDHAVAANRHGTSGTADRALTPCYGLEAFSDVSLPARPAGLTVLPAHNDSGTIASMVIRVKAASDLTPDYEVIAVNDGSADATPEIVDELARTYSHVRVVHHPKNRGYGGALQTASAGDQGADLHTDGDAQYDPAELAALWAKMTRTRIW